MKKIIAAIALATALPAVAHAQAPQAPAKPGCCAGMKEKCACCKGMEGMSEAGHQMRGSGQSGQGHAPGHSGHDAPQQDGKAAPADSHQNHQR